MVFKSGGVWVVFVGCEDVGGGQELLQRLGDEANGVRELRIWEEIKPSCGRLHNPLSEAMVNVVALLQDVLCGSVAPVGEDGSGGGLGEHFGVFSVERDKWYAAQAVWVDEVFFTCDGLC